MDGVAPIPYYGIVDRDRDGSRGKVKAAKSDGNIGSGCG
jgi:hypothetical protein